ncbi:hypothetical protein [Rhodoplanes elegans]|nr:hypothetical protein [Rhodoplanes elegans]
MRRLLLRPHLTSRTAPIDRAAALVVTVAREFAFAAPTRFTTDEAGR